MGELEKYGLLSAALLLLMAGLLAFFGRDSDVDPGAHALSANNEVVDRDADRGAASRDPGAPRDRSTPTNSQTPKADPEQTPIDRERLAGGDDAPRDPPNPTDDETVGPVESETKSNDGEKAPDADAPVHYAVKKGDTLSSIAAAHFGDKKFYKLIEQANPGVDSRKLTVGQELILPAKSATQAPANTPNTSKTPSDSNAPKAKEPAKDPKGTTGKGLEAAKAGKAPATSGKNAVAADKATTPKPDPKADGSPRKASKDPAKPAESAAKKGPREHRVAKGDTLTSIARKYYDDANKWKTIFEANRDKLKSTSIVPEGVVLKIP